MNLPRLVRTLRPLGWGQRARQAWHLAARRLPRVHGLARLRWRWPGQDAPPLRTGFPTLPRLAPPGPTGIDLLELLEQGSVENLGVVAALRRDSPDWRLGECSEGRLWTITLHYHGWAYGLAQIAAGEDRELSARATTLFRHYIGDWIERADLARAGTTELAWNPYATSTRIGWWVRCHRLGHDSLFAPVPSFETRFLRSLWRQASHLAGHLEWRLRANHLMRNLAALGVAGRFFAGARADGWLDRAGRLAVEQADEQVLLDGVHFERSPLYHVEIMDDLATLYTVIEDEKARESLAETWGRMAEALAWLRHPDGDVPLLNDCVHVGLSELERTFEASDQVLGGPFDTSARSGERLFAEAGVAVLHSDPWSVFFDAGELGPDVQPGHGHADTLTFECTFRGRRLIVDPGSYGYDLDDRRAYDRSTAAHNTVTVDGESSSEVWHIFRLGRRARPLGLDTGSAPGQWRAVAVHDGYDWLPGRPRHTREMVVEAEALRITDRIEGTGRHVCQGGLLIEPCWQVERRGDDWSLRYPEAGLRLRLTVDGPERLATRQVRAPYHPHRGSELDAVRIEWSWDGELPLEVRLVMAETT